MIANDKINGRFIGAVYAVCEEETTYVLCELHMLYVAFASVQFFFAILPYTDSVYLVQVRYFLKCYEFRDRIGCLCLCAN